MKQSMASASYLNDLDGVVEEEPDADKNSGDDHGDDDSGRHGDDDTLAKRQRLPATTGLRLRQQHTRTKDVSPTCTRRPCNINIVQMTIKCLRYLGDQELIFELFCPELGPVHSGLPWTSSTLPTPLMRH